MICTLEEKDEEVCDEERVRRTPMHRVSLTSTTPDSYLEEITPQRLGRGGRGAAHGGVDMACDWGKRRDAYRLQPHRSQLFQLFQTQQYGEWMTG